jgi:hypothetical protein
MDKKKLIYLVAALLLLTVWGTRVYYVNANVAKKYEIQSFYKGDQVSLSEASLIVKNISYGKINKVNGMEFVPLIIEMEVQNTSDQNISVIKLIEAKLAYGYDYYQTNQGEFSPDTLRSLPPHTTEHFTLKYEIRSKYKDKHAKLYLDQSLYGNEVKEKYNQGKRYGVVINL